MTKITFVTLLLIYFFYTEVKASTILAIPNNVMGFTAVTQVGNLATPNSGCEGVEPKYLKIIIKPTCYGGNLRHVSTTVNPKGDDVKVELTIINKTNSFKPIIKFSPKATWPDAYGESCGWEDLYNGNHKVTCGSPEIEYECSFIRVPTSPHYPQFSDYLDCTRKDNIDDNKQIQCSFFYSWRGTKVAAINSYSRISGSVNCGFSTNDPFPVTVNNIPGSPTTFGKRGYISVVIPNIGMDKYQVLPNMSTGQLEPVASSQKSTVSATFKQGTKPLSTKTEIGFDEYEQCLIIKASFLGNNRFCGSYYSPLMLFFDKRRPLFVGRSSFPLFPDVPLITWVEQSAPGFFLTLDTFGNKKITSNQQVFSENEKFDNGFESLKRFDDNKDNIIDKKDRVFKKLLLWQDKNGDGVSQSTEVFTLKQKKVIEIGLNYSNKIVTTFRRGAEGRERATFKYKNNDIVQTGDIVDIWLAPIE